MIQYAYSDEGNDMLELIRAGDVHAGDRLIPEEYDEHVGLDGYDEGEAVVVRATRQPFADYTVSIVTPYETVTLDRDDLVMRVKNPTWTEADRPLLDADA